MEHLKIVRLVILATGLLMICGALNALVRYQDLKAAAFAENFSVKPMTAEEIALERQQDAEQRRVMAGGEFHDQLKRYVSYAGLTNPNFVHSALANLSSEDLVVGVLLNGQAYAFPLKLLAHPKRHVVNFAAFGQELSVTYCDLSGCIRVFRGDGPTSIPLRIGGLDIHEEMVLLLNGMRYSQDSKHIPLADFPFTETSWGEWCEAHPAGKLFVGSALD